jgi:Domain of unknown function (DUF6456)
MKGSKFAARGSATERIHKVRSLLTQLAHGATLRRGEGRDFVLVESEADSPAPPGKGVAAALVEACAAQDWLERAGDHFRLSHAGRAWLRRCAADGDAFRAQHQFRAGGEREIDGTRRPVLVNEAESPLGWLKSRKDRNGSPLLSEPQYEAGERLRADYWFAQMSPRVTANWSALAPSERSRRGAPGSADLRDEVIAAKARVMRALDEVGPEIGGILIDICCELKGLEEAEKANGWPQRAGKVVLQIALTRLARHYGLIGDDRKQRRGARGLRHWGSDDYRTTLDAWRNQDKTAPGEVR